VTGGVWRHFDAHGGEPLPQPGSCSSDGWCVVHPDRAGPGEASAVWGRGRSDLWFATAHGIERFDGRRWSSIAASRGDSLSSIAGAHGLILATGGGNVFATDGRFWHRRYANENEPMLAVAEGREELYTLGQHGLILQCDARSCRPMPRIATQELCGIVSAGREVIAYGVGAVVIRDAQMRWHLEHRGNEVLLDGTVDAGGHAVLVGRVENRPLVLRREDGAWTREPSVPDQVVHAIASDGDTLWAIGMDVFRSQGRGWSRVDVGTHGALLDVWASGGTVAIATSGGALIGRGGRWERFGGLSNNELAVALGSTPSDLWAYRPGGGLLLHWHAGAWSTLLSPIELRSTVRISDGRLVAIDLVNTAVYDGHEWASYRNHPVMLRSLFPVDGGVIAETTGNGNQPGIYSWADDHWDRTLAIDDAHRAGVQMRRVFAQGARDRALMLDQGDRGATLMRVAGSRRSRIWHSSWAEQPDEVCVDGDRIAFLTIFPHALWMGTANRVRSYPIDRAIGGVLRVLLHDGSGGVYLQPDDGRTLVHFDGHRWTRESVPDHVQVTGLFRVGDELWATGPNGVVLRKAQRSAPASPAS
jgi:hypothetical protein